MLCVWICFVGQSHYLVHHRTNIFPLGSIFVGPLNQAPIIHRLDMFLASCHIQLWSCGSRIFYIPPFCLVVLLRMFPRNVRVTWEGSHDLVVIPLVWLGEGVRTRCWTWLLCWCFSPIAPWHFELPLVHIGHSFWFTPPLWAV